MITKISESTFTEIAFETRSGYFQEAQENTDGIH